MSKETGGPAFPRPFSRESVIPGNEHDAQKGITKRDYFAAKAMQGILASCPEGLRSNDISKNVPIWAMVSYKIADAILAERAKP